MVRSEHAEVGGSDGEDNNGVDTSRESSSDGGDDDQAFLILHRPKVKNHLTLNTCTTSTIHQDIVDSHSTLWKHIRVFWTDSR